MGNDDSANIVETYSYTAFGKVTIRDAGRRIKKTVGAAITKYIYDGDQVIAEYDGTDTLLRKFVYGPGIDEPICMIDNI